MTAYSFGSISQNRPARSRVCPGSFAVPARTDTDGKGACLHCFGWYRLRDDGTITAHVRPR